MKALKLSFNQNIGPLNYVLHKWFYVLIKLNLLLSHINLRSHIKLAFKLKIRLSHIKLGPLAKILLSHVFSLKLIKIGPSRQFSLKMLKIELM